MKIGVVGHGRMGKKIQEVIESYEHEVVFPKVSLKEATTLSFPSNISLLIDFSHADNLEKVLDYGAAHQLPVVIGTTGYSEEQFQAIEAFGQRFPILYSANFSLGIFVMNQLVKQAAELLKTWQIELIEKHHDQKKDAPSGTAQSLLVSMQEVRKLSPVFQWKDQPRKTDEIGVHSLRMGSLPGEHEVLFASTDEVLSIKHESFSNQIFAEGAVSAAFWLSNQPAGYYQLADTLGG